MKKFNTELSALQELMASYEKHISNAEAIAEDAPDITRQLDQCKVRYQCNFASILMQIRKPILLSQYKVKYQHTHTHTHTHTHNVRSENINRVKIVCLGHQVAQLVEGQTLELEVRGSTP